MKGEIIDSILRNTDYSIILLEISCSRLKESRSHHHLNRRSVAVFLFLVIQTRIGRVSILKTWSHAPKSSAMMIPIATDAPVYHRPIATIGLITVNSAIFLLLGQPQELMLSIGSGWHPTQWVTAAFLHAHVLHLVGNMVFLWAYGLVVEGKIGWWRFLAAYLLMGALQNLLAQTVVGAVNGELRYVLGASGAISSLMAMALLWAPVNEFTVVWGYSFGFSAFARDDELSIWAFSLWFIGWDLLSASLLGFALCTPMLHLTGVAFGLIAGVLFLQLRWVDCENCDVLSLWLGREGTPSKQLKIAGKSAWTMFRKNRAPQKRRRAQPKIVYSQQGIAASEQRRPQELRRPQ